MKKNIIATLLFGFGAIAAITVQAQTIKIDTLNNDIVIPGDIERDHLEEDQHEKGNEIPSKEEAEIRKMFGKALATPPPSSAASGGGCCAPVFPTTYPAFKPCFCPVVINSAPMEPTATNSNIGFEVENVDKGISNWIFFMGMNKPWLAYTNSQAWFECERYYTGNMTTTGTASGFWAHEWKPSQYIDFEKRTAIMTMDAPPNSNQPTDVVGAFPVVPKSITNTENKHALRLNRPEDPPGFDNYREKIWGSYNSAVMAVRKIRIYRSNPYLAYKYAVALSNHFGHGVGHDSYFRVQVYKLKNGGDCASSTDLNNCCDELCCEGVFINAKAGNEVPGLKTNPNKSSTWGSGGRLGIQGDAKFKDWTTNTINFLPYMVGEEYHDFIIAVTASYCKGGHDYGYAYLDLEPSAGITYSGLLKSGSNILFEGPANNSYGIGGSQTPERFQWKVYKVVSGSDVLIYTSSNDTVNTKFNYQFTDEGTYKVKVDIESGFTSANCPTTGLGCEKSYERTVVIAPSNEAFLLSCSDCIGSFAPLVNNKYVLSAWVKQDHIPTGGITTFTDPRIEVSYIYTGTPVPSVEIFIPSGPIIDGWQKVEKEFTIPANATSIQIDLKGYATNETGRNVYYDDIRVFPFRADMKSFVYDPASQKLMAQMDENNYATFYEYDEEGKLKRVKKETERGVMTIKEAGSNSSKR